MVGEDADEVRSWHGGLRQRTGANGRRQWSPGCPPDTCKAVAYIWAVSLPQDTIQKALKTVCKALGRRLVRPCKSLVRKYKDQISDALQNGSDPQDTCTDLGLCSDSRELLGERVPTGAPGQGGGGQDSLAVM